MFKKIPALLLSLLCIMGSHSQETPISEVGKFYQNHQNNVIYMPMGEISFADSIVSYSQGYPKPIEKCSHTKNALGEPDYISYLKPRYVSLGCGGILIVEFKDNGFIDLPGDDLYFFEVGPSIESFEVDISTDGKKWRKIGSVRGGSSSIDIGSQGKKMNEIYYYIRITDLKSFCPGETPGADIDAVATLSGVYKIDLNGDLLFDSGKYNLKATAINKLNKLAKKIIKIGNAKILIQGHTDSDGSIQLNINLSKNRVKTVTTQLKSLLKEKGKYIYTTEAYGESQPTASNVTQAGKQKNRRVEIVVLPDMEFYQIPERE